MNAHLNENLSAYLDGELDDTALARSWDGIVSCGARQ